MPRTGGGRPAGGRAEPSQAEPREAEEPPAPEGRPGPAAILCAAPAAPRHGSQSRRAPREGGSGRCGGAGARSRGPQSCGAGRGGCGAVAACRELPGRGGGLPAGPEARGRSRGAQPRVLQALGGCGAALGCVLQCGQEEAGEGNSLVFCPVVPVRQDAVETAGGKSGDPQKGA